MLSLTGTLTVPPQKKWIARVDEMASNKSATMGWYHVGSGYSLCNVSELQAQRAPRENRLKYVLCHE